MKKKAKRFLASLTAAAAVCSVCLTPLSDIGIRLPINALEASAADILVSGDYQYYTDNNGAVIKKYTGTAAVVTIPGEIDGNKVYAIDSYAFDKNSNLTSVTFPDSLERIGSHAFRGCTTLTSVKFNEGLKVIGNYAFTDTAVTEVSLPSTLTDAAYPFNNSKVTKATFAEGTELIPSWLFRNCSKLTDVTIPETVKRIGSYAFNGCSSLKEFKFHEGLEFLGSYSFSGTGLTEVSLPTTLKDTVYPFNNCNITKATIAEGTVTVPSWLFKNCSKLTDITIPETVTSIGSYAFNGCSSIKSFKFHEGLTFLGSYSFSGTGITEVELPTTLTDTVYPFNGCDITKASFAKGTEKIPSWIFKNCYKLTDVTVPETVTTIGSYAFNGCSSLESFKFHEGITFLGSYSFSGTALNEVNLPSTISDTVYPFNNCNITKATFADGIKAIPSWVLKGCSKLTDVTVPETVTAIGGSAFNDCSSLAEFTFHEGITTLGNNAFSGTSLKDITLPSTLKTANYAFSNSKLEKVTFADGIQAVPSQTLSSCRQLKEAVLPESVKSINSYAFENCTSLSSIELPAALEKLEGSCFRSSGLKDIVIPDSVKNMASYAFNNCKQLKTATIGSGLTSISTNVFAGCISLEKVTLKSTKLKALANSFFNCRKLTEVDYSNTDFTFDRLAFSKCYSLKDMNLVYLNRPTSTMTINTENTAVNGIVEFTVDFETLSGHYNEDSTFTLSLTVPDGLTVLPDTFITDEGAVDAETVASMKIPFTKPSGQLKFSVQAAKSGTFDIDADLIFREGKYDRVEPIHSVRLTADVLSLSAPSTTNDLKINVSGTGPKGKKVDIYLDDKLIGSPVVDESTSKYTLAVELPEGEDGSKYVLRAKYNDTATSDCSVIYSKEQPSIKNIKLGINGNDADNDITGVFTKCDSPVMYYVQNKPVTITADISNSAAVEKVFITSTKNDKIAKLEASYDENTGLWIAKGFFDGSRNYVPGTLNVVVVTKSEYSALQAAKLDIDYTKGYFSRPGDIRFFSDPTGFVFEGAPSNAIKGAEVTLYYMGEDGKAVAWDGKNYDQKNPLITDEFGAYAWDIPEGEWKVVCKIDGYDTMESEWLTIPPVQKGINFSVVSEAAPKVTDISYNGTDITVKFDKYMIPDTINLNTISLDSGSDFKVSPALHSSGEEVTDTFLISGNFTDTIDVNIEVKNGCQSYAGTAAEPFNKTLHINDALETTTTTQPITTTTTTKPTTTTTTTQPATTSTTTKPVTTTTTTQPTTTSTTTKPVTTTTTTQPTTTSTTTKPVTTTTTTQPTTTSTTTKSVTTTTTTQPTTTSTTTKPVTTTTTTQPTTTSTTTKPVTTTTTTQPATTTTSTTTKPVTTTTTTKPATTTSTFTATTTTVTTTEPITTTTTTQPVESKPSLGDYNGDGAVNAVDASYILAAYADNSTNRTEATKDQLALGDINKDGKMNAVDASYVLSYYAYISTNPKISLEEYLKNNL